MRYHCVTHGVIEENEVDEEGFCTDCHDVVLNLEVETVKWLETLLAYARGEKKWDTGGTWVCENHPYMPFNTEETPFVCECGGAGQPPFTPEVPTKFERKEIYEPKGIRFFDKASNREMILVTEGHMKDWVCYKHPDGQWVSLREATASDMEILTAALGKSD